MRRNDKVRVTDTRNGSTREGYFSGSGDWGVRFRNSLTDFRGFQIDDFEWEFFDFEILEES